MAMVVVLDLSSDAAQSPRRSGKSATYWRDRTSIDRSRSLSALRVRPGGVHRPLSSGEHYLRAEVLAEIAAEHGIPPKLLIVHQFREDMIQGKDKLAPVSGVQLVIDADGYGSPELKTAVYNFWSGTNQSNLRGSSSSMARTCHS